MSNRHKTPPDRFPRQFAEALIETHAKLQLTDTLYRWASKSPGEFYKLVAQLMPGQLHITGGPPVATDPEGLRDAAMRVSFLLARAGVEIVSHSVPESPAPAHNLLDPFPTAPTAMTPPPSTAVPAPPPPTEMTLDMLASRDSDRAVERMRLDRQRDAVALRVRDALGRSRRRNLL